MKRLKQEILSALLDLGVATGEIPVGFEQGFSNITGAPRRRVKEALRQLVKEDALQTVFIEGFGEGYTLSESFVNTLLDDTAWMDETDD